jgi:hypothetical protein
MHNLCRGQRRRNNFGYLAIFKNLPRVNNRPTGKNSPNPVTLMGKVSPITTRHNADKTCRDSFVTGVAEENVVGAQASRFEKYRVAKTKAKF